MVWVKNIEELSDPLLKFAFIIVVLLDVRLVDVVHLVVELDELILGQDSIVVRIDALEKHQEFAEEPLMLSKLEIENGVDQAAEWRLVMLRKLLNLTMQR